MNMKCLIFVIVLIMVVCSVRGMPVVWQISIEVGSDKQYKLPKGKGEWDYVNFKEFREVSNEVIHNLERMRQVKKSLEENSKGDFIMKLITCGGIILTGLVGLVMKLKDIQRVVNKKIPVQFAMPHMGAGPSAPAVPPVNYFGSSNF